MASRRFAACCLRISVVLGLLATVPVGRGAPDPVAFVEPVRPGAVDDRAPYAPGELLIKYRPGIGQAGRLELHTYLGVVEARLLRPRLERVRLSSERVDELIRAYHDHPAVEYIEPNHILQAHADPIDPFFPDQYALRNTGQLSGTPGADIAALEAWQSSTGSHDVVVAVIDSGIDLDHPDLELNLWRNPGETPENGLDDDGNGFVDDVHGWDFVGGDNDPSDASGGHGTHVAGIIGAVGDNGFGTAGVAWKVRLLPVRTLTGDGTGTVADAIAGVEYCASMDVDVVNASWGGGGFSRALFEAVEALGERDILFVASAGNDGRDTDVRPVFPASFDLPNVVSVAATGSRDELAVFSNFGLTSVDLAAPGVTILSTLPGGFYEARSGTSFAAPHVTGAVALLRALAPNMAASEIKQRLLATVEPLPELTGRTVSGGRLHAGRTLAGADERAPAAVDDLRAGEPTSNSVLLRWTATGDDGHEGVARRYDVRYAGVPLDAGRFESATPVATASPSPPGAAERLEVVGLASGTDYFFAVRVEDEWGNRSFVSNTATARTLPAPRFVSMPGAFAAALDSGGDTRRLLELHNAGAGTLDWTIPSPASPPTGWLSVRPAAGRLVAGDRTTVELRLDAAGLSTGRYVAALEVITNDPERAVVAHPVTLDVTDAAALVVEPAQLDFGGVLVGDRGSAMLVLGNPGSLPLQVSLSAGEEIELDTTEAGIAPGERRIVHLGWAPTAAGDGAGRIRVESNSPAAPQWEVPWAGRALPPPEIAVSPSRFDETLFTGQGVRRFLQIDNPGDGPLEVTVRFVPAGVTATLSAAAGSTATASIAQVASPQDGGHLGVAPVFVNGGFESGDFEGWVAETNGLPELTPWNVEERFGGFFGTGAPFEGQHAAQNGFDGNAGLLYRLYQEIDLPDDAAMATLVFHDRIQYDGFGIESDQPRVYEADLRDATGAVLQPIVRSEVQLDGAGFTDTGWQRRELDVTPYLGRSVRVELRESIPETFTGPASIEFDGFRIDRIAYPDWLQPGAPRITVPPRGSTALVVDFAAGARGAAELRGTLRLETNVPGTPRVPVEVALTVEPAADLEPPPASVAFGDVPRGGVARREIAVHNRGAAPLTIEAAAEPPFSVTPVSLLVPPGESRTMVVVFAPLREGGAAGALDWTTNDPDLQKVAVSLSGSGVPPPSLTVEAAPAEIAVASGSQDTLTWRFSNGGTGTLDVTLVARDGWLQPDPAALVLAPAETGAVALRVDASTLAPGSYATTVEVLSNDPDRPLLLLSVHAEVFGVPRLELAGAIVRLADERHYSVEAAVTTHGFVLPSLTPAGDATLRVTVTGDYGGADETATPRVGARVLDSIGGAGEDCVALTREYTVSVAELADAESEGVTEITLANAAKVGAICEVDLHRVELELPLAVEPLDWGRVAVGESARIRVRIENPGSGVLELSTSASGGFAVTPGALLLAAGGRAELELEWTPSATGSEVGALLLESNDPARPLQSIELRGIGEIATLRVAPSRLTLSAPEGGAANAALVVSNDGAAREQIVLWTAGDGAAGLRLQPASFELPPGAARTVQVSLDAAALAVGRTTQEVRARSAAGEARVVAVDALVSPAANVVLEPEVWIESEIDFDGDTRSFHLLRAMSPPLGDGSLRVSALGDFGAVGESASVFLEGMSVGRVDVVGDDCTTQTIAPIVEQERLEAVLADGLVEVEVANTPLVGASCPVNRHRIELVYPVAAETLDFGVANPGESRRHRIWIRNTGSRTLQVVSMEVDDPSFVLDRTIATVGAGSRRFVDVEFSATAAGRRDATWALATDDPDRPFATLGLTATVRSLPRADVTPSSLTSTLAPGESRTRIVTLSNQGLGALDYAVAVLPAAPAFVVGSNQAGSVEAGGGVDIEVVFDAVSPGAHSAELRIATSDPDRREWSVPLSLEVVGPPVLEMGGVRRIATSEQEFFAAGATTSHRLDVDHPFEAGASIEVIARGDYGSSSETATVFAEGIELGTFGSTGFDCGTTTLRTTLSPAMFAELAADGVVEIDVRNSANVNPICSTNEQLVRLIYTEPPGDIEFGRVFVGQMADVQLVVANTGAADLAVQVDLSGDAAFSVAPQVLAVAPGAERGILLGFAPQSAGVFQGELVLSTNDTVQPERRLQVAASATLPPRAVLPTGAIEVELEQGGGSAVAVPIANSGGADLEVRAFEIAGADGAFLETPEAWQLVPPAGDVDLPVVYRTRGRGPGDWLTTLRIETNDPDHPRLDLPVRMTVLAAPDIFAAGGRVVLESRRDFAEAGARTESQLVLPETPVGDVQLTLTAIGDFGDLAERATLAVGGVVVGSVGGAGVDCRPAEGTFTVPLERIGDVFPGGVADIQVINAAEVNFFCFQNRHTVRVEYDGLPPVLDFRDVFTGAASELSLRLANRGELPLTVERLATTSPDVALPSGPWVIAPGASTTLAVVYRPRIAGELTTDLVVHSDDPDQPGLVLAMRGRAVPPPALRVDPPAVRGSLAVGAVTTTRVRVANTGGSDLQWGIAWVEQESLPGGVTLPLGSGAGGFAGTDYRWSDSRAPDGPVFDWVEIGGTDTGLSGDDEVSAPIPLGFEFPLYGKSFAGVRVSTDGWLSFTSGRPAFSNAPGLPDEGFASPSNLVAPFWDDLIVGEGSIRYENDGERFIVEYDGVSRFGDDALLTFQVQLDASGRIVFRYRSMVGRRDSATIGIQNANRDRGVEVSANAPYVEDGLAVRIAPTPAWAAAAPPAGRIPPGGWQDVEMMLDATSLSPGSYRAVLLLQTNDPAAPDLLVPVILDVQSSLGSGFRPAIDRP